MIGSTALSYLGNSLVNWNILLSRFPRLVRPPGFEPQFHHLNSVAWGRLHTFSGCNMLVWLPCPFFSSCSGWGSSDRHSICCDAVWMTFLLSSIPESSLVSTLSFCLRTEYFTFCLLFCTSRKRWEGDKLSWAKAQPASESLGHAIFAETLFQPRVRSRSHRKYCQPSASPPSRGAALRPSLSREESAPLVTFPTAPAFLAAVSRNVQWEKEKYKEMHLFVSLQIWGY